ncbi:MAG: beta-lactamase family protein [Candidatus Eremiobacteraeota bacterium]|nr:beta-lactamase family protein [Candidatus Eremiobacteraeota bacterium]
MKLATPAMILGTACIFFLRSAPAASSGPSLGNPTVRNAIVAAVENDRKLYGGRTPVPGVLVGVWDGAGHDFIRPFGFADSATRRPLTALDHFRIGSNTKTFVVAVILQLVDEKKISLDEPLSRFSLGVTIPNAANITIRELCDMRSGLFEAYNTPQFERVNVLPQTIFDPRTVIRWAVAQKPYFAPNKGYHYTNTGYLILGLIIENVTHDSVGDQIRKRLLKPFGLTQTSYPETMAMPDPWARGYGLDEHRNWNDVSNTIPVSLMGAAGAMISDMADMKRWIELYVTGKTSAPATHRALMHCISTGTPESGFGLALGCSNGWYGYTGGLPGYNTANFFFPKDGIFIVAWVDVQADKPAPGVANAIFRDIARIMTPSNAPLGGGKGL